MASTHWLAELRNGQTSYAGAHYQLLKQKMYLQQDVIAASLMIISQQWALVTENVVSLHNTLQ